MESITLEACVLTVLRLPTELGTRSLGIVCAKQCDADKLQQQFEIWIFIANGQILGLFS
jgi:hypothetical protein